MKKRNLKLAHRMKVLLIIGLLAILTTGCGTTAIIHKQAVTQKVFDSYQTLAIMSSTSQDVVVSEDTQDRIKGLVKTEIATKYCPNRFQSISTKEIGQEDLVILINYTSYEEGSHFGRLMLAGIGSMKIHSIITLKNIKSDNIISQAEVGKTFSAGGIYGALTSITDVENWFAEEIAKTFGEMLGIDKTG